jgi:membrane-bound serine protease (ClpP class)
MSLSTRHPWRALLAGVALLAALLVPAVTVRAQSEARLAPGAVKMVIDGPLDLGTLGLLQRAARRAKDEGHELVIVEIDTPGGEVSLMIRFARQLAEARAEGTPITAWVHGEATSAGALVALACDSIYMTSTSRMGSATPVTFGPSGMAPLPEEGGVREKVDSLVRSEFRAVAQAAGRSGALAEAMVDAGLEVRLVELDGEELVMSETEWSDARVLGRDPRLVRTLSAPGKLLNLTAREAVSLGMADGIADSLREVLLRSGLSADTPVTNLERSNSEDLLALLARVSPFLIGLGLLLGYIELKTQGFGLFGIGALICFGVVFTGRYFVGLADVPHLVLLVLGAGLIAVELFVLPGQLWPGILGGLLLFGSLIAMELGTDFDFSNAWDRSQAWDAAFRMVMVGAGAVIAALVLTRQLKDSPLLRRAVQLPAAEATAALQAPAELVGAFGTALTDLRPVGKITLDVSGDREYEAQVEGAALDAGARVVVLASRGGRLILEDAREGLA